MQITLDFGYDKNHSSCLGIVSTFNKKKSMCIISTQQQKNVSIWSLANPNREIWTHNQDVAQQYNHEPHHATLFKFITLNPINKYNIKFSQYESTRITSEVNYDN